VWQESSTAVRGGGVGCEGACVEEAKGKVGEGERVEGGGVGCGTHNKDELREGDRWGRGG